MRLQTGFVLAVALLLGAGGTSPVAASPAPGGSGYTISDLGPLPGGTQSRARGINDAGQIVGSSTTATGQTHAVLWQPVVGTPPTTTAAPAPSPNAAGWDRSSVRVTLTATAA
jgi:probable HAF family extracellular repeat protein